MDFAEGNEKRYVRPNCPKRANPGTSSVKPSTERGEGEWRRGTAQKGFRISPTADPRLKELLDSSK